MSYAKDKYVRLTVAVPIEFNEKLESLANAMHISKTALARQLMESNIDLLAQTWSIMKSPSIMDKLKNLAEQQGNTDIVNSIDNINNQVSNNTKAFINADKLMNELKK